MGRGCALAGCRWMGRICGTELTKGLICVTSVDVYGAVVGDAGLANRLGGMISAATEPFTLV